VGLCAHRAHRGPSAKRSSHVPQMLGCWQAPALEACSLQHQQQQRQQQQQWQQSTAGAAAALSTMPTISRACTGLTQRRCLLPTASLSPHCVTLSPAFTAPCHRMCPSSASRMGHILWLTLPVHAVRHTPTRGQSRPSNQTWCTIHTWHTRVGALTCSLPKTAKDLAAATHPALLTPCYSQPAAAQLAMPHPAACQIAMMRGALRAWMQARTSGRADCAALKGREVSCKQRAGVTEKARQVRPLGWLFQPPPAPHIQASSTP